LTFKLSFLHLLFFLSGFSGLVYQVVWVRVFGNVFGNTLHSTSLVVAVFMLGLGLGSYIVGAWADRRYGSQPDSLLRAYGILELAVGVLGLGISLLLPHFAQISALVTAYSREANGWYALSAGSYLARAVVAVVLLTPITFLMGGTLTLLIRHLIRSDFESGGWRIACLYAVNTAGAALGCVLTDVLLVPVAGLLGTQLVAVFFNLVAGVGAFFLARKGWRRDASKGSVRQPDLVSAQPSALSSVAIPLTSVALALSGFSAMGMEIVWFRHLSILLGGFRAVFSLLLTVILAGIGAGSLAAGVLSRRTRRPAQWWMAAQGLFVALTLLGMAAADAGAIDRIVTADRAAHIVESGLARALTELWFNARPILFEVGLPALLMGFSFPFANAMIQRAEQSVGRRAGVLYLSNTIGAVCGSLAAGFLLLPVFGMQGSAAFLAIAAGLAVVPISFVGWNDAGRSVALTASLSIAGVAIGLWLVLPPAYVAGRAAPLLEGERSVAWSEGLTEVITVVEAPGRGRTLLTNGHSMSSTTRLSQRYMRALAHIPLLAMEHPETVLVIGFGVGNTVHAATMHPSIRRVEVADLSRGILAHAGYFSDVNRDVLHDPRVVVYVNDGRQHLQMQRPASYDLVTLEPPPIGYAGVAALYSRDFYALARTRLTPKGYISQWLPAYQVPARTTLAMIRAFVEVFPQAVLISGSEAELLLIGSNGSPIEIDPERLAKALSNAPTAHADLQRLDLGTVREIVGSFVGSAQTLAEATRETPAVTDDRPTQEYGVMSLLNYGQPVPDAVVDLGQVAAWCPKCFADQKPVPLAEGLDTYLALVGRAYGASASDVGRARSLAARRDRTIFGSAYLGAIVPETAEVHNLLGIELAATGRIDEGITEFRRAMQLEPDSAQTHWHLGAALAYRGARDEALEQLRLAVQLDPNNPQARHDLEVVLAASRR
jgi:predicted membrane-bound spermidine synthase/tetratricopeptide (TPR) repeat protein